jgi:hypothetical protein
MNQQAGNERPPIEATEDDAIDHTIRAKAASEGLRLRLYKAARDDQSVEHIVEFCTGFVSWEFVTLYLDQLRVDQGAFTHSTSLIIRIPSCSLSLLRCEHSLPTICSVHRLTTEGSSD